MKALLTTLLFCLTLCVSATVVNIPTPLVDGVLYGDVQGSNYNIAGVHNFSGENLIANTISNNGTFTTDSGLIFTDGSGTMDGNEAIFNFFSGDGGLVTNISASHISSGTFPYSVLPSGVVTNNNASSVTINNNIITLSNIQSAGEMVVGGQLTVGGSVFQVDPIAGVITGIGTHITGLPSTNLVGTITASATNAVVHGDILASNLVVNSSVQVVTGAFIGDASNITNVNPMGAFSNNTHIGLTFPTNVLPLLLPSLAVSNGGSLTNLAATNLIGTQSNASFAGITTNLDIPKYPSPFDANINIRPVPQVYWFYGNTTDTESLIRSIATNIYTNGWVNYGLDWYEQDLINFTRDGNGRLQYNPTNYPSGGSNLVNVFHQFGIKYYGYDTLAPGGQFGTIGSYGSEQLDAWTLATNFNWDGVKFDVTGANEFQLFVSCLFNTCHPFFVQSSALTPVAGSTTFYNASPFYNYSINSAYTSAGLSDPDNPHVFTNVMAHFHSEAQAAQYITRPGHYVQGSGWLDNPSQVFATNGLECAATLAEDVLVSPFVQSSIVALFTNNPLYLSILRDRAVIPGKAVYTNISADGATNSVWVRSLKDKYGPDKYVMFAVESTNSTALTLSCTNLNFGTNTSFTLTSPWSGAIEAWATNLFTNSSMATNTKSYLVQKGTIPPAFVTGTNWLSSWPWRLSSTNIPSVNIRSGNNPIVINGVTYTNGFVTRLQNDSGPFTNTYIEFPLGGITTNFSCVFGIISAWSGASAGGRLTVTVDGVQKFQSGYITNDAQFTNVNIDTTGGNAIGLFVDDSAAGQFLQMAIANAQIFVPPSINYQSPYSSFNVTNLVVQSPGVGNFVVTNNTNLSMVVGQLPSGGRMALTWVVPGSTYSSTLGVNIQADNSQLTENVPSGGTFYWRNNGTTFANLDSSGQLNANGGGVTNVTALHSSPVLTKINVSANQFYTNTSGFMQQLTGSETYTTAAATGDAAIQNVVTGIGGTSNNFVGVSTTVAVSLAMSYTNNFVLFITNGGTFCPSNISSGAGNSAAVVSNSIQVLTY